VYLVTLRFAIGSGTACDDAQHPRLGHLVKLHAGKSQDVGLNLCQKGAQGVGAAGLYP